MPATSANDPGPPPKTEELLPALSTQRTQKPANQKIGIDNNIQGR